MTELKNITSDTDDISGLCFV